MTKLNIPFLDFTKRNVDVKAKLVNEFDAFIDSGWYVLGKRLSKFEKQYADYSESKYCVGVSTGLDALRLSLEALGVGEGDEVIVPSNTYIATVLAVTSIGATPIFVEPDIETYNIDPVKIHDAISERTKALIPVHLYGQPCEMDVIISLCNKQGISIIEDNAQAQGALFNGRKTGSFGDVNAVSFYPGKNLGALGEAGAVTTNSEAYAQKINALRNYGSDVKYHNKYLGYNNRMDEIQGAFLSVMLGHIDQWNIERTRIAEMYSEGLKDMENIILPKVAKGAKPVWHQFVIRSENRDSLQSHLGMNGVGTLIHYPVPPHLQECYKYLGYKNGDFPIAEKVAKTSLSLPIYPGLTEENIRKIVEVIKTHN